MSTKTAAPASDPTARRDNGRPEHRHLLTVVGTVAASTPAGRPVPEVAEAGRSAVPLTAPAADGYFRSGLDWHNAGDVPAAEREYRRALVSLPTHYGAARYYAKILNKRGEWAALRRIATPPYVSDRAGPSDAVLTSLLKRAAETVGRPFAHPAAAVRSSSGLLVRREHFHAVSDRERAKALFRESIRNIDLELFSYCNRRCLYCPNAFIDRISGNTYMDGAQYRMIVEDLAEIDFAGKVTLNFYNEPLADPVTLRACAELRQLLPRAFLRLNTNGDYLDETTFRELRDAGLNHLMISLHVSKTLAWDDDKVRFRAEQIYERTGQRPDAITFVPGRKYHAFIPFEGMKIEVKQGNYNEYGFNIGGLMKHIPAPDRRESPCMEPFRSLTITYNGELTACCRIRGDAPEHAPYRAGNLSDFPSLYEAWAGERLAAWRRHLIGFNPKHKPCNSCVASQVPRTAEAEAAHLSASMLLDA